MNLDPAKLGVILVVAFVIMGPENLQSSARHLGARWRSFNGLREKAEQQVRDAWADLELPHVPTSPRSAVSSYVTGLFAPGQDSCSTGEAGAVPGMDGASRTSGPATPHVAWSDQQSTDDVGMN